ncbi:MAG: hypothetical protein Q9170_005779 [Blastenia crenularia]
MPRTLPWLKDQEVTKTRAPAPPPAKKLRPLSPSSDSSEHARSVQRARARQRREVAQRAGRTPSTSPPPAPPSIEYMHPGLSHDDIYIMVEDEFLSTAQLFTSHLHLAEYVRLKNIAKARNATLNSAIRPTDSITAMRAETVKKKQAEARAGKNKAALKQMKEDARGGIGVSDGDLDGDEEEEGESDADKAPWVGTSLQGLMAPDARKQNLTSLSGLQGIQSSTRAAKGYAKPDGSLQSPSQRDSYPTARSVSKASSNLRDSEQLKAQSSTSKGRTLSKRLSDVSSSDNDDDLDAPITRPPPPKANPNRPITTNTNPLTLAAEDLFNSSQPTKPRNPHHSSKAPRRSPSPPPHNSLPDSSPPQRSEDVKRRIQARRERTAAMAAKRKVEEDGGAGNVDVLEIPVFLV